MTRITHSMWRTWQQWHSGRSILWWISASYSSSTAHPIRKTVQETKKTKNGITTGKAHSPITLQVQTTYRETRTMLLLWLHQTTDRLLPNKTSRLVNNIWSLAWRQTAQCLHSYSGGILEEVQVLIWHRPVQLSARVCEHLQMLAFVVTGAVSRIANLCVARSPSMVCIPLENWTRDHPNMGRLPKSETGIRLRRRSSRRSRSALPVSLPTTSTRSIEAFLQQANGEKSGTAIALWIE